MDYVIIVAGGSGSRMKSDVPKQFLEINGKLILVHTIEAFLQFDSSLNIIIVIPKIHFEYSEIIRKQFHPNTVIHFIEGGETRFHSVKNGINQIPKSEEGIVFIHDAVRPFVNSFLLQNCREQAKQFGNAIPSIELKDSIRKINLAGNNHEDRSKYRLIQTPQTFDISLIRQAFDQNFSNEFTDDASVFEKAGHRINLIEGNEENIKITTPNDLIWAEIILKNRDNLST